MKNICCIIVTYNIGKNLGACFFSIKDQVNKVIIVDNNSNNETKEYINFLKENYEIEAIFNNENLGIATALNQGVEYALEEGYNWILTMDNDSEATPRMINSMLNVYENLSNSEKELVVGIFPKYLEKGLADFSGVESDEKLNEYKYLISDITSGNLLKADVFEKVGFFDEKLFIDYVDHEFCYRINSLGLKLIKVENAKLLHSLGNTRKKKILFKEVIYTNHSPLRKYYMTRNRFYTWRKFPDLMEINKIDKVNFIKENLKILLLEKNKLKKFRMILKGYIDYKNNKFGRLT